MRNKTYQNKVEKLLNGNTNELERYVLEDLKYAENIKMYLEDLLQHGCQSGMVVSLVYYKDTHNFYNEFADEIDEIREEIEEMQGEPIQIKGDLRNFMAWLGYEETARKIAYKLGIE